ncbi:MAG: type II toxin-antitoxin system HicA family toxin [Thermoleophilaceae bacterium]
MKRRALERHLRAHGCRLLREGGNHAVWSNPISDERAPVARHAEIPAGTVRSICRALGVPVPPNPR